jgi:hypothetical protein
MLVEVIRTSGLRETHDVPADSAHLWPTLQDLIGARTLEFVTLRDGRTMIIDEDGYDVELVEHDPSGFTLAVDGSQPSFVLERRPTRAKKPVNAEATTLYHSVCVPGVTHQIVGDVVLVRFPADDPDVPADAE